MQFLAKVYFRISVLVDRQEQTPELNKEKLQKQILLIIVHVYTLLCMVKYLYDKIINEMKT